MQNRDTELEDESPIVYKNCMGAIARIYGVNLGEMFYLQTPSGKCSRAKLDTDGLWLYEYNFYGQPYWRDYSWVLYELVTGKLIVRKMTTEDTVRDFMEDRK